MDLVRGLQQGGFVIYLRSVDTAEIQNSEICATHPALSDQARVDASTLGASFLALGIPVGQVFNGETCASYETALLAFGRTESWTELNGSTILLRGDQISILREILSTSPQPGMNNVLVGDSLDIEDVTDVTLLEGEAAIYRPLGKTGYSFIARVRLDEWEELKKSLPNLVQTEPCDFHEIQVELVSPLYGSNAQSQPWPDQSDGGGEVCVPEQQFSLSQDLPLPDLITLPPTDLRIRISSADGRKLLRFTNSIMNKGLGAMELWGTYNPHTGKVTVEQRIFNINGSDQKVTVGEFFFHTEHNHWHFGKFATYEIWSLRRDGELDSLVAFSNKISYCLRDDSRADIPNAASRQTYSACDQNIQGISVGWIDTYRYHLVGQSIDITALPDGEYALRSVVDPDSKLWDRNYSNNEAILYIGLEGNQVTVIETEDN